MSSIELLKEKARSFEQNEQWEKALEMYSQAIDQFSDDDTPDIALFNRSGDLATKLGSADQAVGFYEKAVDFYVAAGLHNNAIAVCKKVIRNLPGRYSLLLKMGQIRAAQGFITDARTSFVTYAENVQAAGDLDEAFRALIEYAKLAPDDYEVCMLLAGQLAQSDRADEAVVQYLKAYRIMRRQDLNELAENVAEQIRTLNPDIDLDEAASDEVFGGGTESGASEETSGAGVSRDEGDEVKVIGPMDLPFLSFDDDDEDEGDADEVADASAVDEVSDGVTDEAPAEVADEDSGEGAEKVSEEAAVEAEALAGPEGGALEASEEDIREPEGRVGAVGDSEEEKAAEEVAAKALEEVVEEARAVEERATEEVAAKAVQEAAEEARAAEDAAATEQEESLDVSSADSKPDAPAESTSGSYVDLGAVLLGGGAEKKEKSTRFVVPYEEPTGDDQADFEKMLAQFREKVSENIDSDDVIAHYDLGTAYMEMGLLDEAIGEYQMVLRGTSDDLPTYEMLGQTFLRKEEPAAAIQSLTRGLEVPCDVEEERVGIYYYIGVAHEKIGNTDAAVEFYEKVFALDINFADVTKRLRALRG